MTHATSLKWMDPDGLAAIGGLTGRYLSVDDDTVRHCAALPPEMNVQDALDDYASGYDAGDWTHDINVAWELWDDGRKVADGRSSFQPRRSADS